MAKAQLSYDVVTVDPDELRRYHPDVARFRTERPYTWPTLTHPDASQWAKELREAAIAQKKNLILDTTLGNGDSAVALIKQLQSKGYEVDVRVMATHRLESEVSVDARFTDSLDRKGYGRHVPQEVREHVYNALPGNLDQVHEQTGAPIRIFDRRGQTLFDSRSDKQLPSQALNEAREERTASIRVMYETRNAYRKQLAWHHELPESLARHPTLAEEAKIPLVRERESLRNAQLLAPGASQTEQIYHAATRRVAIKGLGAAGATALAYDAAQTVSHTSDLLHQGNVSGAQSGVLHLGSRTLGMAAGAEIIGGLGLLAGVESGPGLLVTGTVGGIAGAIGGDKIADAIDHYRVYHQKDPQGLPWRYDTDHPGRGWVSDLPPLPDTVHRPVADATLQNRLDYQASTKAAELRMAQPGELPDPYRQPPGPTDPPRVQAEPWTRDPQTQTWTRHVVTDVVDRAMLRSTETASPSRAAELDRAAEQTIAQNRVNSPQGIAAAYQAMYEQRGWAALGPMPKSVSETLREADRTVLASDSHTYTHGADGQWTRPGALYGRNVAEDHIRDELDATQRTTQTSKVGEEPLGTSRVPARLDDPAHPDNALYNQARKLVHELDRQNGRTPDQGSDNMAAALTVAARTEGLHRIDKIALSDDAGKLWAAQGLDGMRSHFVLHASVDTAKAFNMPMEHSAAQWPQAMQQFQQVHQREQAQSQEQVQSQHQATQAAPALVR